MTPEGQATRSTPSTLPFPITFERERDARSVAVCGREIDCWRWSRDSGLVKGIHSLH